MSLTQDHELDAWEEHLPQLTAEQIREMEFTPDQLRRLRDLGIVPPSETFRLETLEHVDWYGWRQKEIENEILAVEIRAGERVTQLQREAARLEDLYAADAERIVAAEIAERRKGKTLILGRVKAKLRAVPGGPRIEDDEALLNYIEDRAGCARGETELEQAVRATRTETLLGWDAIVALKHEPNEWTPKILAAPVKAYVKALPPVPDPETGELLPATIPGVVIEPASERLSFE